MPDETPTEPPKSDREIYRKDQRGAGKFNIVFGLIFLAWTACDLVAGYGDGLAYADLFFGLMAIAFITYGVSQMKAAGKG